MSDNPDGSNGPCEYYAGKLKYWNKITDYEDEYATLDVSFDSDKIELLENLHDLKDRGVPLSKAFARDEE